MAKMNYPAKLTVRYTTDEWASYCDTTAHYIGDENESADRFAFDINMEKATTLHFAICYSVNTTEYWDNNDRKNYSLVTLTETDKSNML